MTEETHTIDEALERFTLVNGPGSIDSNTACVMTGLSWVAGAAWTDQLPCAHPILRRWAIAANDAAGVTHEQRADLLRAGAVGILDTWWVPAEVLLWAWSESPKDVGPIERMVAVCGTVAEWKTAAAKQRPNLTGANLTGADLTGANLTGADLAGANLTGAYLTDANLADADLTDADLTDANLTGADLADAYLTGANLTGARATSSTTWPVGFDPAARGVVIP